MTFVTLMSHFCTVLNLILYNLYNMAHIRSLIFRPIQTPKSSYKKTMESNEVVFTWFNSYVPEWPCHWFIMCLVKEEELDCTLTLYDLSLFLDCAQISSIDLFNYIFITLSLFRFLWWPFASFFKPKTDTLVWPLTLSFQIFTWTLANLLKNIEFLENGNSKNSEKA